MLRGSLANIPACTWPGRWLAGINLPRQACLCISLSVSHTLSLSPSLFPFLGALEMPSLTNWTKVAGECVQILSGLRCRQRSYSYCNCKVLIPFPDSELSVAYDLPCQPHLFRLQTSLAQVAIVEIDDVSRNGSAVQLREYELLPG